MESLIKSLVELLGSRIFREFVAALGDAFVDWVIRGIEEVLRQRRNPGADGLAAGA
jgi:hypothetical protein